ncbi:MAG: hypothetical protein ABJA35_11485 [Parafilimonas sp.]
MLIRKCFLFVTILLIFGSLCCVKEYSYENGENPFAEGTLHDSTGNCFPNFVTGTFYSGIQPNTNINYLEVEINITKSGSYYITTDVQNGFHFADSGYFQNAVDTIIRLLPIGIPEKAIQTFFAIRFNNETCNVDVNVKDSIVTSRTDTVPDVPENNYWIFYDSTNHVYYNGALQGNFVAGGSSGILAVAGIEGYTTSDTLFQMYFVLPGLSLASLVPGDYTTGNGNFFKMLSVANNTQKIIFSADNTAQKITIHLIDYTSGVLSALFYGTAIDEFGNEVKIDNGSFKVEIP